MNQRVIKLLGEPTQNEDHAASEAITPGHLVERQAASTVRKHATAGGATALLIALEREEMGRGVEVDYAIGDQVKVGAFGPGTRFAGYIASGQNLNIGDKVESAGNGTFRVLASGTALATCLEDTGAVVAATRVAFEAL